MAFERWDVVAVPSFILGLPEDIPTQFGVVISAPIARETTERYWVLQIPNPAPAGRLEGDIEVPYLGAMLPPTPAVIRTSSIFAAHWQDLEGEPALARISILSKEFRKPVMAAVNRFLPRGT